MEHYFISFFPLLCVFSICVMVINYILWKELKTFCFVIFVFDFFFTCYFKDTQRNKQLWYWNSIVPAPPEHNPKKTESRLLGCLQYACVNISVCRSHIIFFTESSSWNKDSVFSECSETFVGPYMLNLWGFLFIGLVVIDLYSMIVTGTSRSREKAYVFIYYKIMKNFQYRR